MRETLGVVTRWNGASWEVWIETHSGKGNGACLQLLPNTPDGTHGIGNLKFQLTSFDTGKLILPSEATTLCSENPNQNHRFSYTKSVIKYRQRSATVVFHEDQRQCPTVSFEECWPWISLEDGEEGMLGDGGPWTFETYDDADPEFLRSLPSKKLIQALGISNSYEVDALEETVRNAKDAGSMIIQIGTASLKMEVPRIFHRPGSKSHDGGCELIFKPEGKIRCCADYPHSEDNECGGFHVTLEWRLNKSEDGEYRDVEVINVDYLPLEQNK